MRIGMALRSIGEKGGIGVYTRYLVSELLKIDADNEYVLFYPDASHKGRFAPHKNVTEVVLRAPGKALWDQVAVPLACWRHKVDVVLHPKFTVPLFAPCRTVMVSHGADWLVDEYAKFYSPSNVALMRVMFPLYCRRATRIISVSQITTDLLNAILNLPPGKAQTVYFGPGPQFRRVEDPAVLQAVKDRYQLPDKFILTLSGHNRGKRKNTGTVLKAFAALRGRIPHKLVVGGVQCDRIGAEFDGLLSDRGDDILFPGWIDQSDLPAIYSLADAYVYPSFLEAFPIPLTEAMACGTPIVTSNVNGLAEIAGDAGLLVDPNRPEEVAEAIYRVVTDYELRASLVRKGYVRSATFSWARSAQETLAILTASDHDSNRGEPVSSGTPLSS